MKFDDDDDNDDPGRVSVPEKVDFSVLKLSYR